MLVYILHTVGTRSLGEGLRVACWRLAHRLVRKGRRHSRLETQKNSGTNKADSPYTGWPPTRRWRVCQEVPGFTKEQATDGRVNGLHCISDLQAA